MENIQDLKSLIEALLIASSNPVKPELVAQLIEQPTSVIQQAFSELVEQYNSSQKGFYIASVAGGYRFQVNPVYGETVAKFLADYSPIKISKAALETLAIIAYRQPISRAQISAIRGVNSDSTVKFLLDLGLIEQKEVDPGPGNALLLGTTELFLEKLGLNSISDLPKLTEFIPDAQTVSLIEERINPFVDE